MRDTRVAQFLVREAVHVDPVTKKTYRYLDRGKTLAKYTDRTDVFGSFTSIPKLGINPQSKFRTPIGIYSYPVDYLIEHYYQDMGTINVPYPEFSKQNYIYLFSVSDISRCLIFRQGENEKVKAFRKDISNSDVDDLMDYCALVAGRLDESFRSSIDEIPSPTEEPDKYEAWWRWLLGKARFQYVPINLHELGTPLMKELVAYYGINYYYAIEEYQEDFLVIEQIRRTKQIPDKDTILKKLRDSLEPKIKDNIQFPYEDELKGIPEVWDLIVDGEYNQAKTFSWLYSDQRITCDQAFVWNATRHVANNDPRKWTGLMRQMGLIGAIDYGTGTIHPSEETQAMFFDPRYIKVLEIIDNRPKQYGSNSQRNERTKYQTVSDRSNLMWFDEALKKTLGYMRNYNATAFYARPPEELLRNLWRLIGWANTHLQEESTYLYEEFWNVGIKRDTIDLLVKFKEKLTEFLLNKYYDEKIDLIIRALKKP